MAERPILFNAEMVRAILDGRKTQTRRIAKTATYIMSSVDKLDEKLAKDIVNEYAPLQKYDILWVRETWAKDVGRYMYRANYSDTEKFYMNGREIRMTWHPSIHMPREAARLFLRVEDVRIERLQDISEDDALAEGANAGEYLDEQGNLMDVYYPHEDFVRIWNSTIKKADISRYGWDANPWVWVYEFVRLNGRPAGLWADRDAAQYADQDVLMPAT